MVEELDQAPEEQSRKCPLCMARPGQGLISLILSDVDRMRLDQLSYWILRVHGRENVVSCSGDKRWVLLWMLLVAYLTFIILHPKLGPKLTSKAQRPSRCEAG